MSDTKQKFNVETLGNCPPEVAQYCAELENINAELLVALENMVAMYAAPHSPDFYTLLDARSAIAKARGEDQ